MKAPKSVREAGKLTHSDKASSNAGIALARASSHALLMAVAYEKGDSDKFLGHGKSALLDVRDSLDFYRMSLALDPDKRFRTDQCMALATELQEKVLKILENVDKSGEFPRPDVMHDLLDSVGKTVTLSAKISRENQKYWK